MSYSNSTNSDLELFDLLSISSLAGTGVDVFGFGIETCVFLATVYFLLQPVARTNRTWFNIGFITTLWLFGCFIAAWDLGSTIISFVLHPQTDWWSVSGTFAPMTVIQQVSSVGASLLGDGLMFYRAYMIWDRSIWVALFGLPLYLTSIGGGCFYIWTNVSPLATWQNFLVSNGIYLAFLVTQNVAFTTLIVTRLLMQARNMRGALGEEYAKRYSSIIMIVIESAAPLTLLNILLLIFYPLTDASPSVSIGTIFASEFASVMQAQLSCISPTLIIMRVALGRSWSQDITMTLAGPSVDADARLATVDLAARGNRSSSDGDDKAERGEADKGLEK
jgi:hypothetical protein